MGAIRLLSDQLINRIAAGEVVERPASALKELIENSLDAGADRIEIDTEAGGRKKIMVADNGRGMARDDLLLAVERHATSKLEEETDLLSIGTLGFRGEALPSIASVSRFSILSSDRDDGRGARVVIAGGKITGVEDAARDRGATVEVLDLFYNVPARRKFLKSVNTEAAHLLETAQRYALAHSDLRLVYRHDGQELLAVSPREDDLSRAARVLGRQTARGLFPFENRAGEYRISGFLGRPEMDRSRAGSLYLYVNRRPVSDRLMVRAVMEAYRGRLASGRYPVAVVFLDLDPQMVDVNVHPAKAEVRFRRPGEAHDVLAAAVARALSENLRPLSRPEPLIQPGREPETARPTVAPPGFQPSPREVRETAVWYSDTPAGSDYRAYAPSRQDPAPTSRERDWEASAPAREAAAPSGFRAVGQVFQAYILAQGPDALFIVDQHAAHERILYEKIEEGMARGRMPAQGLLIPETIELSPSQAAGAEEILDELAWFGFDLSPFGGGAFLLRAVPAVLADRDYLTVLGDVLENAGTPAGDGGLERFRERVAASMACRSAVKSGRDMTLAEMDRLLADLTACHTPTHCPHGRPLIFSLDRKEIEKRFRRI